MYLDGFRLISHLNTQVRTLAIVSQIVKILGTRQILKQLLKKSIANGNAVEKTISGQRDKIIRSVSSTKSFNNYLGFANSLGLITIYNEVVTCSRLGTLLNKFTSEPKQFEYQLNDAEKLFYLFVLFRNDADLLLLTIELLQQYSTPVSQEDLSKLFQEKLKHRLRFKQKYATEQIRFMIHDKYQAIEDIWKKHSRYAEHVVPPRLAWLKDLGMLTPTKKNSYYQLTVPGEDFYHSLLQFPDFQEKDVNEQWFRTKAMAAFTPVVFSPKQLAYWSELEPSRRVELLGLPLKKAFNLFDMEGVRRISLYPALLFIAIRLAVRNHVIVEFQELEEELKNGLVVEKKRFAARPAARMNEGYITMNLE